MTNGPSESAPEGGWEQWLTVPASLIVGTAFFAL